MTDAEMAAARDNMAMEMAQHESCRYADLSPACQAMIDERIKKTRSALVPGVVVQLYKSRVFYGPK